MTTFLSIALTLFFVIDALGIIPTYLHLVKKFDRKKQRRIAIRELIIALIVMILFLYVGPVILTLLNLDKATVQIGGGIVLFLIAIRLIFPSTDEKQGTIWGDAEPFVVPIAIPLFAGPSLLAIIMILAQEETRDWIVLLAAFAAWLISAVLILSAKPIHKTVGDKGLLACQKLMGLIVCLISVQMTLTGIKTLISTL